MQGVGIELVDRLAGERALLDGGVDLSGAEAGGEHVPRDFRQLTRRGIGVLVTDHSVRETLSLVDRAYLIHGGTVMIQGKPEVIMADPDARRVYLGESFSM